jgi:hypothetical protein
MLGSENDLSTNAAHNGVVASIAIALTTNG